MTVAITKGKLMKWIILTVIAVIIVILFRGPAQAAYIPRIMTETARYSEFMAEFSGYKNYTLCDVHKRVFGSPKP